MSVCRSLCVYCTQCSLAVWDVDFHVFVILLHFAIILMSFAFKRFYAIIVIRNSVDCEKGYVHKYECAA